MNLNHALAALLATRWCPHTPHPKQAEFLNTTVKEVLYGGSGGGGKSDALLMAALQHVDVPGYSAIIFRRTFADLALAGAIMDRSMEWLKPTRAHWDGVKKQWRFPSGARLSFGYLQTAKDRYRYQSAEFQYIGWDELTHWDSDKDYRYLFSRLRANSSIKVPLRVRAATNPGGAGHEWVLNRWAPWLDDTKRTARSGDVLWFQTQDGKQGERCSATDVGASGRSFIQATIDDNPSLNKEDYFASLAELDSVTLDQIKRGIWKQDASGLMYRVSESNKVLGPFQRGTGDWTFMTGHDYGVTNNNAITVAGWERHSDIVHIVRSYYVMGLSDDMAEQHRLLDDEYRFERTIGDIGGLGKAFAGELITRHNIPIEQASKSDKLGFVKLFNGALERGKIRIYVDGCTDLLQEASTLMRLPNGNEAKGQNHALDSALYTWRECRAYMSKPRQPPPTRDQILQREAEQARDLLSGKTGPKRAVAGKRWR